MFRKMLIVLILGQLAVSAVASSSVVYSKVKVGRTVADMVTVNLADPEVKVSVALARGGTGRSEPFKSIVNRTHPSAAISGTFFDTRTYIPTGDIAVFGTVVHTGCIGSALCIGKDNKAEIVPLSTGRKQGWSNYETVLCAGPVLVARGKVAINLQREGFHGSLYAPATRTAVGITRSGKLVLAAINHKTTLYEIARVLIAVGVNDALCLDGGSSTGFYASNKFMAVPYRRLTNLLVVYPKSSDYENAKMALAPASLFPKPAAPLPMQEPSLLKISLLPPDIAIPRNVEWHQSPEH